MEKEFELGSVVILKSGGPKMTITNIRKTTNERIDTATCVYFYDSEIREVFIPLNALKIVN